MSTGTLEHGGAAFDTETADRPDDVSSSIASAALWIGLAVPAWYFGDLLWASVPAAAAAVSVINAAACLWQGNNRRD